MAFNNNHSHASQHKLVMLYVYNNTRKMATYAVTKGHSSSPNQNTTVKKQSLKYFKVVTLKFGIFIS